MKFTSRIVHDDASLLDALSIRPTLSSYPLLFAHSVQIKERYDSYIAASGNAWNLELPLGLPAALGDALVNHYTNEVVGLEIIEQIRQGLTSNVCPMCGSFKAQEVDHLAPKNVYPEFAFFSPNLVPACDCNRKKGTAFKGDAAGERVLHPYFDEVLNERLIWVEFSGDLAKPERSIQIFPPHNLDVAVQYHVQKIILKTGVLVYAANMWSNLLTMPEEVLLPLKYVEVIDEQAVEDAIKILVASEDKQSHSQNNWISVVLMGVIHSPGALHYIAQRVVALRADEHDIIVE